MQYWKIFLSVFFSLCMIAAFSAESENPGVFEESVGDMHLQFSSRGVRLSLFDIPIIKTYYLTVVKPDWSFHYYLNEIHPDMVGNIAVEEIENGKKITVKHFTSPREESPFLGTETYTMLSDNTLKIDMDFSFRKDVPAIMEWNVGGVNPMPFIGCEYTAKNDENTTKGVIPIEAESSEVSESMFARDFRKFTVDSRFGPFEIRTSPGTDASFFDYRKNRWAETNNPILWFGLLERPIVKGEKYSYSIVLDMPEKPDRANDKKDARMLNPGIEKTSSAQFPNYNPGYIIPEPKSLKYIDEDFKLESTLDVYAGNRKSRSLEKALNYFADDLKNYYDIKTEIDRSPFPGGDVPHNMVFIGKVPKFTDLSMLCENFNLAVPEHEQGYCLVVRKDFAFAASRTDTGLFYGLTTLLQLVRVNADGVFFRGAEIEDYPSLNFRGIHCLSGKGAGDEIAKAVRDLMARFKINNLVWECEYIIWDSHPEIAHPEYGMKKSEAKKVIEAAEEYFIEIIPLVQSLGHSEWIFVNDQNLDLAEDPETPYAYNPTNPDTYKFIFEVYQEAVEFFEPEMFHIGHDEVTMRGRFPYRSKDTGKSVTELVMEDIHKLHDWFTEKGIRVMLWSDMFLFKTEATSAAFAPTAEDAEKRRELLPKDVLIADWHYDISQPEEYISLDLFRKEGFDVVGSPWYRPDNIRNLAKACVMYGAKGLLHTTWAGFNFRITNNEEAWYQYWAYLWGAHYAWTGENTPVGDLPFIAQQVFLDQWFEKKPVLEKREGFMVDLSRAYNRSLADNENKTGWLGFGPELDMSLFPAEKREFGETKFMINPGPDGEAALVTSGIMNPEMEAPDEVRFKLPNVKAKEIHFMITASFPGRRGSNVGEIVIEYEDGTRDALDLVYGRNVFAFNDPGVGPGSRPVWHGSSANGQEIALHDLTWENRNPEKSIRYIILRSAGTETSPILLAITGVN